MRLRYIAPLLCALGAGNASAVIITTETTQLGPIAPGGAGATFRTGYTIANEPGDVPIEELSIFFEVGLFSNLMVLSSPIDWDSIVVNPDPNIPDDGFFDTLAFAGPLAPGETLSGFAVSYDYLGSGAPGAQRFSVIDPITFNTLATGVTGDPAAIPEPATLVLLGAGLFGVAASRRRSRRVGLQTRNNDYRRTTPTLRGDEQ